MNLYVKSLDGLRAVAIGIVLAAHLGFPYPRSGGVGADIFFALSGYLITNILLSELEKKKSINISKFYIRRGLRLVPALIVLLALFLVVQLVKVEKVDWNIVLIVAMYLSNWARALFDYNLQSLGHTWSLAIEEQYYLIWPGIVWLIWKATGPGIKSFWVLFTIFFVLGIYRFIFSESWSVGRVYFGLDTHCDGLVLGSSLPFLARSQYYMNGRKTEHYFSFYAGLCGFALLAIIMYKLTWMNIEMVKYGYTLVACGSFFVLIHCISAQKSFLNLCLENSIVVFIGKISYGIYLYHYPIFEIINYFYPSIPRYYLVFPKLALTFGLAWASFRFVEAPFIELKRKFG